VLGALESMRQWHANHSKAFRKRLFFDGRVRARAQDHAWSSHLPIGAAPSISTSSHEDMTTRAWAAAVETEPAR
jgi:hypothetical protein